MQKKVEGVMKCMLISYLPYAGVARIVVLLTQTLSFLSSYAILHCIYSHLTELNKKSRRNFFSIIKMNYSVWIFHDDQSFSKNHMSIQSNMYFLDKNDLLFIPVHQWIDSLTLLKSICRNIRSRWW